MGSVTKKVLTLEYNDAVMHQKELFDLENAIHSMITSKKDEQKPDTDKVTDLAEILFITSYPPRECGIATYSQDLIRALNNKFSNSLSIKVCAMEANGTNFYR